MATNASLFLNISPHPSFGMSSLTALLLRRGMSVAISAASEDKRAISAGGWLQTMSIDEFRLFLVTLTSRPIWSWTRGLIVCGSMPICNDAVKQRKSEWSPRDPLADWVKTVLSVYSGTTVFSPWITALKPGAVVVETKNHKNDDGTAATESAGDVGVDRGASRRTGCRLQGID